jgi:hypothetical protein
MNTELEQRLRADMEQATRDIRVPPGLALKAYRHSHKRTMTTRAVVAAGTAAVLTAGTLTLAEVTGAFGQPAGGSQVRTTAYVISRVERALSAPDMSNMVGYTRTVYPAGTTLQPVPGGLNGSGGPRTSSPRWGAYELLWAYHHTTKMSGFTATGQRVFDEQLTVGKQSLATTVVAYPSHTWWTSQSARPAVTGSASAGCLPAGQIRLSGGPNAWPAFIHSQLACGAYTVAGRQALGGVDALRITGSSGQFTLWVNPVTYLPMRLQEGGLIRINFQWLPPTPANLAMLNLAVPASFHQVVPPS